MPTQDAYLPNRIIYSFNVANSSVNSLAKAEDLYYEPQNQLFYLADTGNKRILVFDKSLKDAYQIGEGILQKPEGVYATSDGKIYVADYDAQKVFIFDASGNVVKEIAKPDHPLFGTQSFFRPSKIVVDDVGTMYIVDAGNANGLVQITSEGAFSDISALTTSLRTFHMSSGLCFPPKPKEPKWSDLRLHRLIWPSIRTG